MNSDDSNASAFSDSDEVVRITHEGKVGIGTDNPDQTLHVMKGSAGTVASDSNAVITLENSCLLYTSPSPRDRG